MPRTFLIYGICLPLAVILGYLLAAPLLQVRTLATIAIVLAILLVPLVLRFHYPLLVLGWNFSMIIFFLPGAPKIWMPLVLISLGISLAHRAIDQRFRFVSVPEIARPLLILLVIILLTAKLTGGIGLKSLGGGVYGGKRYFFLIGAIIGYFALTAQRIPVERANRYMGLFLLGGVSVLVGDLLYFNSGTVEWVFWLFPPNIGASGGTDAIVRFGGIYGASTVSVSFMLAKYGIRGIFGGRQPIRTVVFVGLVAASLLGGFRSALIAFFLVFSVQFFLEGLHRTRLLPIFLICGCLGVVSTIPFIRQMPRNIQRALSFLPLPVDPMVREEAKGSSEWRLQIWKAVLPQVPRYLLVGKGLAMSTEDFEFSLNTFTGAAREASEDQSWAALAGDYHNGPLSVIIPFGIWGALAFLWLLVAGFRVLYRNFKYGDESLRTINTFLLASYISKTTIFFVVFGGFYGDMQIFVGILGMSACLNGGVARPVAEPVPKETPTPVFAGVMRRPEPSAAG